MASLGVRALIQLILTGAAVSTAVTAFVIAFMLEQNLISLNKNYTGDITQQSLPCVRGSAKECPITGVDRCWDYCCPFRYYCAISPTVGVSCELGMQTCGNRVWCMDLADVSGKCESQICQRQLTVIRATSISYICAAIGVFVDLVDIISIFTIPDAISVKSSINLFSAVVKFTGQGALLVASSSTFLADLENARCFNADGMNQIASIRFLFSSCVVVQILSGFLSILLSPFSAYYGGKLTGSPYTK